VNRYFVSYKACRKNQSYVTNGYVSIQRDAFKGQNMQLVLDSLRESEKLKSVAILYIKKVEDE